MGSKGFQALSPGMLSTLGLPIGWIYRGGGLEQFATAEASAFRAVVLLVGTFPEDQRTRIYEFVNRHIEDAVQRELQRANLASLPTALVEDLHNALAPKGWRRQG